ncbi:hypothetical protein H0H93_004022 [Arthromyces matolae]|nr:hypothetical protein H0H93_004022 [Arthromyces matolae]
MLDSSLLSSSMDSTGSSNSFDFIEILDPDQFQLPSSMSLDSVWSTDSNEFVPPFPERPPIHCTPLLLDDRCMLHPFGRGITEPDKFKISTSIPTPPRMGRMLLEPLCLDKWLYTVTLQSLSPGHTPWDGGPPVRKRPWIPSGSAFSPDTFKQDLDAARAGYRRSTSLSISSTRTKGRRKSQSGSEFRKALVFEREITLQTDGERKRWSLQVPAETMNPEMVDIMLELQDLNSYFKDSLANLDASTLTLDKEREKLGPPPALVVSNSHSSFPLLCEASATSTPRHESVVPLAARRGKRLLPPLSLARKVENDPYPGIPTAFLGSPSTYSPKYENVAAGVGPSLDLEHMVSNLRMQCDFQRRVDDSDTFDITSSELSFAAAASENNNSDSDDWAFAVSFLDSFDSQGTHLQSSQAESHPVLQSKPLISPNNLSKTGTIPSASLAPRAHCPAKPPPSPVPTIPLPPLPSPTASLRDTSPSPRGILKSCKNVRFASLPERNGAESDVPITPGANGLHVAQPPKAPSRSHIYSRPSKESNDVDAASQGVQETKKKTGKSPANRPASAFPAIAPSKMRKIDQPHIRPQSAVVPLSGKQASNQLGRRPLGRLDENQAKKDVNTPNRAGLRWTMNDMSFRRGSPYGQSTPEGSPRSRMPVPLRNILTRFK